MSFASFGEFLNMGGHALYVWLSYGAAAGVMLYNWAAARRQQRRALQDVLDRMRREAGGRADGRAGRGDEER
ncbi:MAG: heme exporter protein CcmD [Gammaproteobacteria bacterium]|jgi:heme exporter protein D|nr:heme exporter protein CcmD [Gammaproteobacteria bacterium]|tara:strand:- start:3697 stop:3912 length:216 start_codon:yes stop_codon:yes gene_type:complete